MDWDDSAAGQSVTCPVCGAVLTVPGISAPPEAPPDGSAPAETAQPPPGAPAPPAPPPVVAPWVLKKPRKGLAIASMAVGLASCFPCFWLGCGFLGIIGGIVAIGLGIPAMIGKTAGKGFGITGVATGIAAVILSLLPFGLLGLLSTLRPFGGGPTSMPAGVTAADSPGGVSPPVLTGGEVTTLLTAPLKRTANAAQAEAELRKALTAYPKRRSDGLYLYECVQNFRLHLAYAGKARLDEPEHQRMFQQASDELVDAVLEKYRQAGELQRDGKWSQAIEKYREVTRLVPVRNDPFRRNVTEHMNYCRRRMRDDEGG